MQKKKLKRKKNRIFQAKLETRGAKIRKERGEANAVKLVRKREKIKNCKI